MNRLGFIGGGRIVNIMLKGLFSVGKLPPDVVVYDCDENARQKIIRNFPGVRVTDSMAEAGSADCVVLAIHPQALMDSAHEIVTHLKKESFVLSLIPKITIRKTVDLLGGHERIARMNPNAPSLVNRGFNPIAYSSSCTDDDVRMMEKIFGPLGSMPAVDDAMIDSFAVITAMGYTYFDYQCAELFSLARQFGIPEDLASQGIKALFGGVAETVLGKDADSDALDLVPVRPLKDQEEAMKNIFNVQLKERYAMLAG